MTHTVKVKPHRLTDDSFVYQVMIVGPLEEDNTRRVMSFDAISEQDASDMADAFVAAINENSLEVADLDWLPPS